MDFNNLNNLLLDANLRSKLVENHMIINTKALYKHNMSLCFHRIHKILLTPFKY